MIAPKFYSQISVCPACGGWGTSKIPAENYKSVCRECSGDGVAVFQSQTTYVWDAPFYVDYALRTKAKFIKIVLIAAPFVVVLILLLVIRLLIMNMKGS